MSAFKQFYTRVLTLFYISNTSQPIWVSFLLDCTKFLLLGEINLHAWLQTYIFTKCQFHGPVFQITLFLEKFVFSMHKYISRTHTYLVKTICALITWHAYSIYCPNANQNFWPYSELIAGMVYEFLDQNNMMTSSNGNIFRVTGPLCGEFTGPGEFPAQRPVTRSFDVFFDLRLNKRLSKQPWGWWFETSSWSLRRQCNDKGYHIGLIGDSKARWLCISIRTLHGCHSQMNELLMINERW